MTKIEKAEVLVKSLEQTNTTLFINKQNSDYVFNEFVKEDGSPVGVEVVE